MDNSKNYWSSISIGTEITERIVTPSVIHLFMFSALTWNRHMIHYNESYAKSDGLQDVAVHRALLGNYLSLMLLEWLGNNGLIRRLNWKVVASAYPDNNLHCKGIVTEKLTKNNKNYFICEILIENSQREKIVVGETELEIY